MDDKVFAYAGEEHSSIWVATMFLVIGGVVYGLSNHLFHDLPLTLSSLVVFIMGGLLTVIPGHAGLTLITWGLCRTFGGDGFFGTYRALGIPFIQVSFFIPFFNYLRIHPFQFSSTHLLITLLGALAFIWTCSAFVKSIMVINDFSARKASVAFIAVLIFVASALYLAI